MVAAQLTRLVARDVAQNHTKAARREGGSQGFRSHDTEKKGENKETTHFFFRVGKSERERAEDWTN